MTRCFFGVGEAGCFPNLTRSLHDMASGPGRDARAGDPVAQLTMGRCADAAARRLSAPLHFVATAVQELFGSDRHPVGHCFLHLVSARRPEHSPRA